MSRWKNCSSVHWDFGISVSDGVDRYIGGKVVSGVDYGVGSNDNEEFVLGVRCILIYESGIKVAADVKYGVSDNIDDGRGVNRLGSDVGGGFGIGDGALCRIWIRS